MNSTGSSSPRSGCCQRTSASTATTSPSGQLDHRLVDDAQLARARSRAAARSPCACGSGPACGACRRTARSARGRAPWRGTSRRRRRAGGRPGRRRRVSASAMPMLAVMKCSPDASTIGWLTACATRSATRIASRAPSSCSHTIRNSSPPSRATVSDGRTASCSRGASATSSSSPAEWPSESLTSLNWSRSSSSTATARPSRRRRASAPSSRSRASARFGSVGQRVVQRAMADLLLDEMALDRAGDDVGDGAQEVDLVGPELPRACGSARRARPTPRRGRRPGP